MKKPVTNHKVIGFIVKLISEISVYFICKRWNQNAPKQTIAEL